MARLTPAQVGQAVLTTSVPVTAGSHVALVVRYRAGSLGLAEGGSVRLRFATALALRDLQTHAAGAANLVTAEASTGAKLQIEYDGDGAPEPWSKELVIRLLQGSLDDGDGMVIRLGDKGSGGPGLVIPETAGATLAIQTEVDPYGTGVFSPTVPLTPVSIVPGKPITWRLVLPSLRRVGEPFRLGLAGVDAFGNVSDQCEGQVRLKANRSIAGLPETFTFKQGVAGESLEGVAALVPGDLTVDMLDGAGEVLARSNPMRVVGERGERCYWGDLHAASDESGGQGSAHSLFTHARDQAFLDMAAHMGLDRLTTDAHWQAVERGAREMTAPGRFVGLSGFEWSGGPGTGGARGVVFPGSGGRVVSASPLLRPGRTAGRMTPEAGTMLKALEATEGIAILQAGRQAFSVGDVVSGGMERAVEVHSARGTVEWLLTDALKKGLKVGVVAGSDAADGQPGTRGGLTCFMAQRLTPTEIVAALRRRHTYATTGSRSYLHMVLRFPTIATHQDDAEAGAALPMARDVREARMGDVVRFTGGSAVLRLEIMAEQPLERIDLFNGTERLRTFRTFTPSQLSNRIRLTWSGADGMGGRRASRWDGEAQVGGTAFQRAEFFGDGGPDADVRLRSGSALDWRARTLGGRAGLDIWLEDPMTGWLRIKTPHRYATLPVSDIGMEGVTLDCGGVGRTIHLCRLPDPLTARNFRVDVPIDFAASGDQALWVRVMEANGQTLWSSPIYVTR